ncbi:portal protein, partial [Klebsiella pneumoniae]|nr:portal protein [Klebsiella pneumoniae]
MDVQRVENVLVSMLVDNAVQSGGDNIPMMDIEFLPGNLREAWEMRNKNRPAMLPMQSMRDAKGNMVAQAQVAGFTPSTPLSAGAAGLL